MNAVQMRNSVWVVSSISAWLFFTGTSHAKIEIDMKGNQLFQKQLDKATESVKSHLFKETKFVGVPVRIDFGNEGGISIKSAILEVEKKYPLTGKANLVFDLHFRHVVQKETKILGVKIPAVILYDRHEDLVVEYDITQKTAKARVLKGPFKLSPFPEQDYEVWINIDLRD